METQPLTFDALLDTIERLPIEQQETLLDVLHNRLIELRREQIAKNAAEARELYLAHKLPSGTVDDLIADLSSGESEG